MFFIPGVLISAVTFPGVIIHEWAHKFFCERLGVVVYKVKYFQLKNPAGYVLHESPKNYNQIFWISIGPLLINSVTAIILSFVASQMVSDGWVWAVLYWVAISAGMHSFPSDQDMKHISSASTVAIKNGGNILHYLAFPFVWLVWIANKLRVLWFDAIWAFILVGIGSSFSAMSGTSTPVVVNKNNNTVIVGEYSCLSYAASQADSMQPSQTLKSNVNTQQNYVTNLNNELSSLSSRIDADIVDKTDQQDIDRHNQMVDDYNARLATYNSNLPAYHSELAQYNAVVDKYNNYLSQNCSHN